MLAAIVLVWVGGPVPAHLAYTCASMGRQRKARLVVIYETSAAPLPWTCRRRRREGSVETHELCDGCVAALHARRLAPVAPVARDDDLGALFADVLALAPQVLAEFKPTWGVVFSDYLRSYTHWTYTDADVVFGSIDAWLDDDYSIDVETWSFEGDAGRVFLRGQWALHKNEGYVNELWRQCPHLSSRLVENLRYKLAFFRGEAFGGSKSRERLASDARRRLPPTPGCDAGLSKFVSAEGCYSCVVFRATNLSTRIVPNMLSDHSSQPVYWRRGSLARCRRDCAPPRPLVVRREPARFVQDCHDMNWICRSVPAAALHVVPNPRGPFDAVETTQRGGTAILVADHENKNTSRRHAPLFHFRKWADYGAFEVPTFPPARARSFEIHYDGIRVRTIT